MQSRRSEGTRTKVGFVDFPWLKNLFGHNATLGIARMAELVDAADLKSVGRKAVGVQVPLWAPPLIPLFKGVFGQNATMHPKHAIVRGNAIVGRFLHKK